MPKKGKFGQFKFHGAFAKKSDAREREEKVGGFIREFTVRGQKRYSVLTKEK